MKDEIRKAQTKGPDGLYAYYQALPPDRKFKGFILILATVGFGLFLRFLLKIFQSTNDND